MVNQQNKVKGNPGMRLTYQGLFRTVRSNQADISSILEAVESVQRHFRTKSTISLQQCEHVEGILRMVLIPVQDLLEATTRLPDDLDLHRTPLVIALHKVINAVEGLAPLIAHYPFANQGSSHPTIAQRRDIQYKFDLLIDGCHDILRQSIALLDIARFPAAL